MTAAENVVPMAAADPPANDVPPSDFQMPAHFKAKRLKAAWQDLVGATDASMHTREMRFTFEFAATLMAKFRAGTPMTATESKELKRLLVTLGLAKGEDAGTARKKKGKLSSYIR
jgi:hypothetical protein